MLRIENLTFRYKPSLPPIFDGLSLDVTPGRIYGLLGKNGIGKSTLLYMMSGLMFPHSGRVTLDGVEVRRRYPETLEKLFLIPEEFDLPAVSVDTYVRRNRVFYPRFSQQQFEQYLRDFELDAGLNNLSKASMGQKKKYLVSFALATNSPLLLMVEPNNGMVIPSNSHFRKVIASVLNDERSIVISTHQVRDLENMIDHIVILDNGKFCLDAGISEIISRLRFVKGVTEAEVSNALYSLSTIAGYSAIFPNESGVESLIDIEMLFNYTTGNPQGVERIFSTHL